MLSSNFSFICRKSKCDRNGKAPIELSIVINGSRVYKKLEMKCSPSQFKALTATKNRRTGNWLTQYLEGVYGEIQRVLSDMQVQGVAITAQSVKDALSSGVQKRSYTLKDLSRDYLSVVAGRTGIETYRRYELAFDLFLTVVDKGIDVSAVKNADILKYKNLVDRRFDGATAYGYCSRLKSFFIFAVNNSKISVNPFSAVRLKRVEKKVEVLSEVDYISLRDRVIGIERLDKVRDLFIFSCNSGLAFCDVCSLCPEDFSLVDGKNFSSRALFTNDNSTQRDTESTGGTGNDTNTDKRFIVINKKRKKTGVEFFSVVLPDGVRILEKYGYCLPKLSNQKVNSYAKELQDICQISSCSSLHFHLCRHFYISRLVRNGVDISIVQKCAGHSRILQTQKYLHLDCSDVVRSVSRCL